MSKPEWTGQQKNAIESKGGTLLVSAAAGSGKTAVLVERIKRKIIDKDRPCSVNNLLVVTFTNAAAANMKTKIAKSLSEAIKEDPGNARLRSQLNLLPFAKISTIDKFCIDLVRDNFHSLDISPDFRLIESSREAVLRNEAMNTVLDNYSASAPEGYDRMMELICDVKDDSEVSGAIKKVYIKSQAYPFPDERLDYLLDVYKTDAPFEKTVWGKAIYNYIAKALRYCISQTEKTLPLCENNLQYCAEPLETMKGEYEFYNRALSLVEAQTGWEELREIFLSYSFKSLEFGRKSGYPENDKAFIQKLRKNAKDTFKSLRDRKKSSSSNLNLFGENLQQINEDKKDILPALECLISMVRDFEKEYSRLKKKENYVDFNDTLHSAIYLLCAKDENGDIIKDENGCPVAGPLAKELAEEFDEILVDEYQDVNEAQELLFRLLSKDGSNLFMVGDVKQSIYGFREAMPELFLGKQKSFAKYDAETYPATVVLGKNFRSVSGITENINHIFSRVMTEGIGGLEYNEDHYLHYNEKAQIHHEEPDTELHFVCNDEDKTEAEINYIADYIESNIGTLVVKDDKGSRPAQPGDFAVLVRVVNNGYAERLADVLKNRNLSVALNVDRRFFEAPEVRFMLSLLRIIANPFDEVSLLAVMLSPVYGFTPDDVAKIKINFRKEQKNKEAKNKKLFHAVRFAMNSGDEKAKKFLDEIERLRNISFTVGAEQLLHILLDETGYFSIVSVLPEASSRTGNLRLLCEYAAQYESAGRVGLTGFLRYIERAEKTQITAKAKEELQNENAVRIMTIHRSKGLEFPVCILANCGKQFNTDSNKAAIQFARNCGIGLYSGGSDFVKYNNIIRKATLFENAESERAEELRNLYVALTRAKEKLLIVTSYKTPAETKNGDPKPNQFRYIDLAGGEKLSPYSVLKAGKSIDVIASALINHPDAVLLRGIQKNEIDSEYIDIDFSKTAKLKIVDVNYEFTTEQETSEEEKEKDLSGLVYEIGKRAEYVYPYSGLEGKAAKKVASDFAAVHESGEFTATTVPAFISSEELSPAQKGTATHKFMQFCSFETADVDAELARVVGEGLMLQREADAVDKEKTVKFLSGDLVPRINASPKVYREQCFTCAIRAGEVYPDLCGEEADEIVVVDGVADLAFEEDGKLVIVDYKTDGRVTDEILRERYSGQLRIYARCLAELLNIEVKETLIYSFSLGKVIEITQ